MSRSLVDRAPREEGLSATGKCTKEEREEVARQIRSGEIPGLTVPAPTAPSRPTRSMSTLTDALTIPSLPKPSSAKSPQKHHGSKERGSYDAEIGVHGQVAPERVMAMPSSA